MKMKLSLEKTSDIFSYIEQNSMISKGDRVLLGLSGGPDSVCLLFVLLALKERLDFSLEAVHINHMIRGQEADEDQAFVEKLCNENQVTCHVERINVVELARKSGRSLEEEARIVRYEAFERYACDKIAVAHNANDNAETVLFHMARGCGLDGVCGIAPVRGKIVRPLLLLEKSEILEMLESADIPYRIDSTNSDVEYDRNRIRHNVMKELSAINSEATAHISQMAAKLSQVASYINNQAMSLIESAKDESGGLRVDVLNDSPELLKIEVIKLYCSWHMPEQKDVGQTHIDAVAKVLESTEEKRVNLPHSKVAVVSGGLLFIEDKDAAKNQAIIGQTIDLKELESNGEASVKVAGFDVRLKLLIDCTDVALSSKVYTKVFDYDRIKGSVVFRTKAPGDFLVVNSAGGTKTLSDYFVNEKIPRYQRDQVLVLADDSHIMWAVGYRISEYYKITSNTSRILEISIMEEKDSE